MIRVRVLKAREQTYWYADEVGNEFNVIEIRDNRKEGQWTVDNGDYNLLIEKRDCEVVQ